MLQLLDGFRKKNGLKKIRKILGYKLLGVSETESNHLPKALIHYNS